MPFTPLDLNDKKQHNIYMRVVELTREVYTINNELKSYQPKRITIQLIENKRLLINQIEILISKVYSLDF